MFKLILLILFYGFILISPKSRFMVGRFLKEITSFLLWPVKYENRKNRIWINQVGFLAIKLSDSIK